MNAGSPDQRSDPGSSGDPRAAARAIDALRRGWAIAVTVDRAGSSVTLFLQTIENAPEGVAERAEGLLLSGNRAATLKLANQLHAASAGDPVQISAPADLTSVLALAIADPVLDMAYPMKGPFVACALTDPDAARAAIELARLAGLLPAFYVLDQEPEDVTLVTTADVAAFAEAGRLHIAARAPLPVSEAQVAEIVAFRSDADATEHVALVIGQRDGSVPVVRLHSECLTGDVLGSLKCDCGPQLHGALARIGDASWGVLLYLRQEGRGIGLINKLRAYALQDQGFDTVDANVRLGFAIDARDFGVAARMLDLLGISSVALLTNNPQKAAGLSKSGIDVAEILPLKVTANLHNRKYLDTKRDRTGHKL